jgi:hypothetical protein
MSRKHFSLLLAVTLVVAVMVLLVPGKTSRKSDVEKAHLLPALQEQVNDLDWMRISGAGGAVIATLARGDGFWKVEEEHGYPADWNQLRTLLADLARAEIVESKTANPAYYARLGVEDVSQADATGVMLEFAAASGLPALVIGNRAQGRDGHYVRLKDAADSFLIDRSLEVPREAMGWLDKNIVHIADTEVVEVEIVHADGERIVARKTSADDENFALQDIPEGREIQSDWAVDSLANGLASLTFEAVVPADGLDWSDATRYGLVTADGLRIDAELVGVGVKAGAVGENEQAGPEYWIRLQAGLYRTAVDSGVTPPQDGDETVQRADTINRRVGGWAYRIPKYKFDAMTKHMADLLRANDSPGS